MLTILFAVLFPFVENGRPVAAFDVADTNAMSDVVRFNSHLSEVTGTELPTGGDLERRIAIRLEDPADISHRFAWMIRFPDDRRMEIVATRRSLMAALVSLIEESCDARFLGSERCMFQFEPRRDAAVEVRARRSAPHAFTLHREVFRVPGYRHELGLFEDGKFRYTHGIPIYAFPKEKYNREGWPEAIMPTLKDGTKLRKPPARVLVGWQPCYSNPETARIAAENVLDYLRGHPGATSITLGVNDMRGYCECAACHAMDDSGEPAIFTNNRLTRSQSYYTFVNAVAAAVEKEFPNVRIGLLAYTGTIMPPTFDVARNVVPMMTFDLCAAAPDPETVARQEDVIRRWGAKVRETGTWSYDWGRGYLMPRVDFAAQAHRLKFLYENGGRAYFGEAMLDALEGPKLYLISKLLADVDLDPDRLLDEWYVRYAGKAAEKPLRELYRHATDYWRSPEMRKTPLWQQHGYIYVQPTETRQREHLQALVPGETQRLLALAEQVRAVAVTSGEKRRAEVLVRHFEILDVYASFLGSAYVDPATGEVGSPDRAVEMLNVLADRADVLMQEYERAKSYFLCPDFQNPDHYRNGYVPLDLLPPFVSQLSAALIYRKDMRVLPAVRRLASAAALPAKLRAQAQSVIAVLEGSASDCFADPGFVRPLESNLVVRTALTWEIGDSLPGASGKVVSVRPSEPIGGDMNPYDNALKDVAAFHFGQKVPPGYYLATVKVRTAAGEARHADFVLWRKSSADAAMDWASFAPHVLKNGEWRKLSAFCRVDDSADGVLFGVRFRDFKPGEAAQIADVRLVKFGDVEDTRFGHLTAGQLRRPVSELVWTNGIGLVVHRPVADRPVAFAGALLNAGKKIRFSGGERLSVRVRVCGVDPSVPAVVGAKIHERVNGSNKEGKYLFWNKRVPKGESVELVGSVDGDAFASCGNGHRQLLLNLFVLKGSGPVAVESVDWRIERCFKRQEICR